MHYDAFVFVRSIQTRHWLEMLNAIDAAVTEVQDRPAERQTPSAHGERVEFLRFLVAARTYLLSEGRLRPNGLEDLQFLMLRPLCEQLVAEGRFAYDCLTLFTALSAAGAPFAAASLPRNDP